MRHGDQTPTCTKGVLSWGIGRDPSTTYAIDGLTFKLSFGVTSRSTDDLVRVAVQNWSTLQEIALEAARRHGALKELHPRGVPPEQRWFVIDSAVFRELAERGR